MIFTQHPTLYITSYFVVIPLPRLHLLTAGIDLASILGHPGNTLEMVIIRGHLHGVLNNYPVECSVRGIIE